ncbi:unnamed protein product [Ectocarpus sp. 12 AP-2014]
MASRAYNVLDGMGEAMLALARKHSTPQQWAAWLKVPLQGACREGDIDMVSTLLKAGAASSGERERDGETPLHAAAEGGSLDVVMALLREGRARRDVNKVTRWLHHTPLYCAALHGHADIALALLRAGADVDFPDTHGWTPLMCASSNGSTELVSNLLLNGASPKTKDKWGCRPLHCAVPAGNLGAVRLLLKAGASPNSRRRPDDMSAVDLAVERGTTDVLLEILAARPHVDALDDKGVSALGIAARKGHAKALDVLIDAGADVDEANQEMDTPLHLACMHLQPACVRTLLRHNADEVSRNEDLAFPDDVVGHAVAGDERDEEIVEWIYEMLARAPADRVWRRRGWLAMLRARRHRESEAEQILHPQQKEHSMEEQGEKGNARKAQNNSQPGDVVVEAVCAPPSVSRRKLSIGAGEGTTDRDYSADRVHPSLKRFHWNVTTMIDTADELVFRKIVTYL